MRARRAGRQIRCQRKVQSADGAVPLSDMSFAIWRVRGGGKKRVSVNDGRRETFLSNQRRLDLLTLGAQGHAPPPAAVPSPPPRTSARKPTHCAPCRHRTLPHLDPEAAADPPQMLSRRIAAARPLTRALRPAAPQASRLQLRQASTGAESTEDPDMVSPHSVSAVGLLARLHGQLGMRGCGLGGCVTEGISAGVVCGSNIRIRHGG